VLIFIDDVTRSFCEDYLYGNVVRLKNATPAEERDSRIGDEHVDLVRAITAPDYTLLRVFYDFDASIATVRK